MILNRKALQLHNRCHRDPPADEVFLQNDLVNGKLCIGYEKLAVGSGAAVGFAAIPARAETCIMVCEADATEAGLPRVVRFREDGVALPTAAEGMPLGDNGIWECKKRANLLAIKFIGITAGKTHSLKIQYYEKTDDM